MANSSTASKDVLCLIDLQHDFMSRMYERGPKGEKSSLNLAPMMPANFVSKVCALIKQHDGPIYVSQDWHPKDHCSFMGPRNGAWPVHCVAGSWGAEIHRDIQQALAEKSSQVKYVAVKKACDSKTEKDANSMLDRTTVRPQADGSNTVADDYAGGEQTVSEELKDYLMRNPDARLKVAGVATDVCVISTVVDAIGSKDSEELVDGLKSKQIGVNPSLHDRCNMGVVAADRIDVITNCCVGTSLAKSQATFTALQEEGVGFQQVDARGKLKAAAPTAVDLSPKARTSLYSPGYAAYTKSFEAKTREKAKISSRPRWK